MRATARGLETGTPVRVSNPPSHRHARGWFVRMVGALVEYRSGYNGGTYLVALGSVHIARERNRLAQEARRVMRTPKRRVA